MSRVSYSLYDLFFAADIQSQSYSMYLDDGVSRDSAPSYLPQYKYREEPDVPNSQMAAEAQSKYREVKISQVSEVAPSFDKLANV